MRAYALAGSFKRTWGIVVFLFSISPAIMALVSPEILMPGATN